MIIMQIRRILTLLFTATALFSCSDAWDEHTSRNKDVSNQTIYTYLQADPQFSQFVALIDEVGYKEELTSSKQITVFALTNGAMEMVPSTFLADQSSKKDFVGHHITYGRNNLSNDANAGRIQMLSSKWLEVEQGLIDGLAVLSSSQALLNGFVNVMDEPVLPRPTIWEYVENMAPQNKHVDYLNSLTSLTFSPDLSTQIGVNDLGQPVYDSVFIFRNSFNDNIADLSSEDSTLTLFIVEDQVLDQEYQKFWRYYRVVNGTTARDTAETKMRITRDYVFNESYSPGNVPAMPVSANGIPVAFSEDAVVESFKASNGYVYVVSSAPVEVADRIRPIIVEGESPEAYYRLTTERADAQGYLRIREHASGGHDFVLDNHIAGSSQRLTDGLILPAGFLPSIQYRVYWRAINDFRTSYRYPSDNELRQRLGTSAVMTRDPVTGRVTRFAPPVFFTDFIPVTATEYSPNPEEDEVFVGTVNFGSMRNVYLQLVPEGESTHHMAVTVDYIKLVPVLN